MKSIYGPHHRTLQDWFDTRRMADLIETNNIRSTFTEADRVFLETRDMFWLASADLEGRPTVSYKGGDPGFVRVVNDHTLIFPIYDGNGMFLSAANIAANNQVGLLFMDFEKPNRLRVQGTATISNDDPLIGLYPEAQLLVRVTPTEIFLNCNRYVHHYQKVNASRYVPRANTPTPLAGWKRIDILQNALPRTDQRQINTAHDLISLEDWLGMVARGDDNA
ncbi:MAG: pyridoxamine 5'-phosphate oxidase family protein [Pleurocapsa sp. SU_196_0]|nr:pyridoxamine 5'-phosphate oxidase family protein [Pleurocapsa sp. SU_196_0]